MSTGADVVAISRDQLARFAENQRWITNNAQVTAQAALKNAVHALLNIAVAGLFVASLVNAHAPHAPKAGGYVVAFVSAHLSGNLVYEHGVGVGEQ